MAARTAKVTRKNRKIATHSHAQLMVAGRSGESGLSVTLRVVAEDTTAAGIVIPLNMVDSPVMESLSNGRIVELFRVLWMECGTFGLSGRRATKHVVVAGVLARGRVMHLCMVVWGARVIHSTMSSATPIFVLTVNGWTG